MTMKTMCSPVYQPSSFVATNALAHLMYCYKLLVSMNQRLLKKLTKERNKSGPKWPTKLILFLWDATYILLLALRPSFSFWDLSIRFRVSIMATCITLLAYLVEHSLINRNRTSCAQVHELPQSRCRDNREGTLFSSFCWRSFCKESEIFYKICVFLKLFLLYTTHS